MSKESRAWRIANTLNRLGRTCWCDLVDWVFKQGDREVDPGEEQHLIRPAENFHPLLWEVARHNGTERCRRDAAENGACYCAKFRTAEAEKAANLRPGFIVPASGGAA